MLNPSAYALGANRSCIRDPVYYTHLTLPTSAYV